jgi:glycosyltransferase involved in cell wall biosynthesis/putative flippase GtrA
LIGEQAPLVMPAAPPATDLVADEAGGNARSARLGASRGRHAAPLSASAAHGVRFTIFSAIGGVIFLLGLGLQAALTGHWHVPAFASYIAQAVVSVELSFVLNRWLTWRDRDTALRTAFGRFNAQKAVTVALNAAIYAGLLRLGMNYLLANVLLTIVFTVVNYAAGDKLVFSPRKARSEEIAVAEPHTVPLQAIRLAGPPVSVVIPCRNNEATIGAAIQSLLDQDYAHLEEIILIGSPDDTTWNGLEGIDDPRLTLIERAAPPGVRDANFKRDTAIKMTRGELVALVDSDIVLPPDWLSTAVTTLQETGVSCVAGGMRSIHDSFWGRYTDNTVIGAKTPRIPSSYVVTSENFGKGGHKPPITANALFTRELYDTCAIDPTWSHGSYEDYEWFWRVTRAGFSILVCRDLFGWHHHRRGMRALVREYRRSARGCAYFIKAHRESPFARLRLRQAVLLPLAVLCGALALAVATMHGRGALAVAPILGCLILLTAQQILRFRRLEAVAYPAVGLTLGLMFTTGLVTHLIRTRTTGQTTATSLDPADAMTLRSPEPSAPATAAQPSALGAGRLRRLLPLAAILAVQAGLSVSMVWSNTAFSDEANYLSIGHELIGNLLHGTAWPTQYAHQVLSGSPYIYPPLGAIADSIGGLAGARILSMFFLLGSTVLLYSTATRLFGRNAALIAAALWAAHSPTMQLGAFATYDALSVSLTALSAWLAVRAGYSRGRRGELVAASAAVLALANVTAYSGIVIDPLVIAFAFAVWIWTMGARQARFCIGWFMAACVVVFGLIMTFTKCWTGIMTTVIARHVTATAYSTPLHVFQDSWTYTGLILVLAVVGAIISLSTEQRSRAYVVMVLAAAALAVPLAQAHETTAISLKKHLAYGAWFAVIAAGYGCQKLVERAQLKHGALVACSVVAFTYPAVSGWWSAWHWYQSWNNASSLVAGMRPVAARATGNVYVLSGSQLDEPVYPTRYYLFGQGNEWERVIDGAPTVPDLSLRSTSAVVLFYPTSTSSSAALPTSLLTSPGSKSAGQQLLNFLGSSYNLGQLSTLTKAIESGHEYQLVGSGPYNSNQATFIYAIWARKGQ